MKKTMPITVTFLLLIESLTLLAPGITAKALPIGVYTGTHLVYGMPDGSPWVIMNPTAAPPLEAWQTYVDFAMINITVTSITLEPNVIAFDEVAKFQNGTVKGPFKSGFNINTAVGGGFFFIAADLESHSRIYPGDANNTWTINETRIDHTHWEGRRIAVLNYTTANPLQNSSSIMAVRNTVIYWDQVTGVLLSAFEKAAAVDPKTKNAIEATFYFGSSTTTSAFQ